MNYFEPKDYQKQVLHSISQYFEKCRELKDPNLAFYKMTGVSYQPLKSFAEGMPYFCLRVPTGGGKTWLAATSIQLINRLLLRTEHSVILWLVPSNQIREQTLQGLKDREHPLHAALLTAGAVTVLSLDEAKSVTPATLNTSTTVIVATRQAFQVASEENRKVYENNGALMAHFDSLNRTQRRELLKDGDTTPYSLANVLRLRRPFVIVDEAHNNRTELGFDTLAKFNPSGIMELTATPDLIKTPSNVLYSVSAAELKDQQMIKMPILLEAEPDWQKCLSSAVTQRNNLQVFADKDYQKGSNYLRPIVLIQAEPKKAGIETRDVFNVKQELIDNYSIPEEEIVIATGEEKGLSKVAADYPLGIKDKACPIKFVITQKALAEGWDCPFAYILVSIANVHSSTAVEQLLGRILRQPDAVHRHAPELNQSYSYVVSSSFTTAAAALKDSLVNSAGFDRKAVGEFVKPLKPKQDDWERWADKKIPPIPVVLPEKPNLTKLPKATVGKVTWKEDTKTLTVHNALTDEDKEALKISVQDESSKTIIDDVVEQSRADAYEYFQTPAERGVKVRIPQLAIYVQGELQLFDDAEMLDYPWDLSRCDTTLTKDDLSRFADALKHSTGKIDINEKGKVEPTYMGMLQRDLSLVYEPEHWDNVKLTAWLCRNIPNRTVTHPIKRAFIAEWLQNLIASFNLVVVNEQKFFVCTLLEKRINALRKSAVNDAYQETLFEKREAIMSDDYAFEFPVFYSPNKYYDPDKYGYYKFRHHYYGQIGEFDSKEEFACACHLDQLAEDKHIKFWLRNLVHGNGAFSLQKATGKFFPDFVCVLPDDSTLVVEYKGGDRFDTKKVSNDKLIGELWASLSNGRCHFIMVTDNRFDLIDTLIESVKVCCD